MLAEFASLPDDTNGLRLLVERTDPKLVRFELDIGWAVSAGQRLPPLFELLTDELLFVGVNVFVGVKVFSLFEELELLLLFVLCWADRVAV